MAFNLPSVPELDDPLMGFRFGVFFLGGVALAHPLDFRFQGVSGLEAQIGLSPMELLAGGNAIRRLPEKTTYKNLVLTRGMPLFSTLRMEIQESLMAAQGIARNVMVSILNEDGLPMNSWLFSDAYPVNWSLSPLDADSGKVIVETIELTYSKFRAFSL